MIGIPLNYDYWYTMGYHYTMGLPRDYWYIMLILNNPMVILIIITNPMIIANNSKYNSNKLYTIITIFILLPWDYCYYNIGIIIILTIP